MVNATAFGDIVFIIFICSFIFILVSAYLDSKKNNKHSKKHFISIIMPSYNDADSLEGSIKSIFNSYEKEHFELVVINDKSSDNTAEILNKLKKIYPIKIINNIKNLGKVKSINNAFKHTKGKIILIVDSDTHVTKKAINDILIRLENEKVGGVSCRYIPINKGFLSIMQRTEYGMLSLIQRSYNYFSTISFWGGCMAVKRDVFEKVGLLSENCLVEDGDLALKIGEAGWKAHESSVPVYSYVPDKLSVWYRQKLRWGAGGMQNIINHFKFFISHPIVIFFFITYSLLTISFAISLINNFTTIRNFYSLFGYFRDTGYSLLTSIKLANVGYSYQFLKTLGLYLLYPVFSIPYVVYNFPVKNNPYFILLIFPFSIIYMPILAVVTVIGFFKGAYKALTLGKNERGW